VTITCDELALVSPGVWRQCSFRRQGTWLAPLGVDLPTFGVSFSCWSERVNFEFRCIFFDLTIWVGTSCYFFCIYIYSDIRYIHILFSGSSDHFHNLRVHSPWRSRYLSAGTVFIAVAIYYISMCITYWIPDIGPCSDIKELHKHLQIEHSILLQEAIFSTCFHKLSVQCVAPNNRNCNMDLRDSEKKNIAIHFIRKCFWPLKLELFQRLLVTWSPASICFAI